MQQHNINYLFWRIIACSAIAHIAMVVSFQSAPEPIPLHNKVFTGRFVRLIYTSPHTFAPKKPKSRLGISQKSRVIHDYQTDRSQVDGLYHNSNKSLRFARIHQQMIHRLTSSSNTTTSDMPEAKKPVGSKGTAKKRGKPSSFDKALNDHCNLLCGCHVPYRSIQKLIHRNHKQSAKTVHLQSRNFVIKGNRSKGTIARVIRRYWFHIKYCYDRALRRAPKLAGKITIRWIIGENGSVQTASVKETTLGDETMENCLLRRIQRWRFPATKGRGIVVVNSPFIFTTR